MNAIITYIFGQNSEILREPLVQDSSVEYICVTDQHNLHSKTWHIVYDELAHVATTREKMVYVKYNPFKYTNANKICVLDGTLQLTGSLDSFFSALDTNELLIKSHPQRNNLSDELDAWITLRNMPVETKDKFYIIAKHDRLDLNEQFLIESCIIGYRRTEYIQNLCNAVIEFMKFLGVDGNLCMTNQCVLTYLIKKYQFTNFGWINQSLYAKRYRHGSWIDANR